MCKIQLGLHWTIARRGKGTVVGLGGERCFMFFVEVIVVAGVRNILFTAFLQVFFNSHSAYFGVATECIVPR